MPATQAPYSQYFDKNGDALDAGYVWFGAPNQNPKTVPISVYWDANLTQPAPQPLRTLAGYISRNGSPAQVFTDGAYSQTVENKRGEMVYYAANSTDYSDLPIRISVITGTDGQTLVTLPFSYTRGNNSLAVYQNGILLLKDRDYTETSTTSITLVKALRIGPNGADEITAIGGRLINAASAIDAVSAAGLAAGSGAGLVGYDASLTFPVGTVGERLQATTYTVDAIVGVDTSPFIDGDIIVARGRTTPDDGGGGSFLYYATSIGSDDNVTLFGGGKLARLFVGLLRPEWAGAVGDWNGTTGTDDYTALQRCLTASAALKIGIDISGKKFRTQTPLSIAFSGAYIEGSGWDSGIYTTADIDIIRVDIGGAYRYFETFKDFTLQYVNASAPTTGACIRYYDSLGTQQGGGTHGTFIGLNLDHKYGIVFDRAKLGTFAPAWPDVADYGHFKFERNNIKFNSARTAIGIWFKGGPGAHNEYSANDFTCVTACVQMGGSDDGVGDQTFGGDNHFLDAAYGIDIVGPTTVGHYNQNITIVGNQFDGIVTNTVRMSNMQNFRVGPNNSTASVGLSLTSCTNYITEDRNTTTFSAPVVFAGGTSGINTTSAVVTDTNGTRYAQEIIARQSANDRASRISGGNLTGAGAQLVLYGGASAAPNRAVYAADRHQMRSQNEATTWFDVQSTGVLFLLSLIGNYANDAAAAAGGVPVGGVYRNGSVMMIRVV